ncbi:3-hydroxyisobutyrate dehydrogenase [Sinobacterium caligoides]|uniref:3-hydroxyisobutyrate dehydrogenase n=2 Tax=Sinobacterium caligoides TaxID=933926 RepID=A0A3N2DN39_9GAMM|nr:3-hydroxyisobutyrate dehydrogenase [Sinobacterium caligoides]
MSGQNNQSLPEIGFIGLGNIGKPMALKLHETLLEQGAALRVYDYIAKPMKSLSAQGATACDGITDFSSCQLVGVCVRDDDDVDALLHGAAKESGLLSVLAEGAVIAIHSTVTRDNILRWSAQAAERGIVLVDAPVTGGAEGAQNGTLCYMVGASEEGYRLLARCYGAAAKEVLHAGPVGSGIVLKLANNLMTYAAFVAVDEALALVEANGLKLEQLLHVGEINGVVTAQMQRFISNREMLAQGCSDEDMAALMGPFAGLAEKDLEHALTLAEQSSQPLAATQLVREKIRATFLRE